MSYGGVMVDNSSVNFYYMLRPKRKQIKQIATETIYHYKPKGRFFQTKGTVLLVCGLCGLLEIRHSTALTTGAKHWHRQKAVFYVFCFSAPQYLSTEPWNYYLGSRWR